MDNYLGKVTAFVTRQNGSAIELLLFKHPNAGIQIPGGTIERGESHLDAVVREVYEETGLTNVEVKNLIGEIETKHPDNEFAVIDSTKVYSRPDLSSFDWVQFRRGITVSGIRQEEEFWQVAYEEYDQYPDPNYLTYGITGWVPKDALSKVTKRYLYHIVYNQVTPETWEVYTDNSYFKLFWAPLSSLPEIVAPQYEWLSYAINDLGYVFK